jgi:transposase
MINYSYDKIKSSICETYEKSIEKLDLKRTKCPNCGAIGQFKAHGDYERHVIVLIDEKVHHEIIRIKRVKCLSCCRTHALLPSFIIPYCSYTYSFILKCLEERVINRTKLVEVCEQYDISFQLLYSWLKRFKEHHVQSYQVYGRGRLFLKETLVQILQDFSSFINLFYQEHRYPFMQIIRSP